ncbi:MAG: MBL fold metallo-hydrolase [Gemmataceae bacterium]
MAFRLAVLASGSSGNSTLLESDGFSVLIDAGLGPRQLASRLADVGATWQQINAVVLTHTHSDHWRDRTLEHLRRMRIPLYCHAEHHDVLRSYSPAFPALADTGLVRAFERDATLMLTPTLRCRPIEVRHDSEPTFAFRFEGTDGDLGRSWAVSYAADLGCWSAALAAVLANADVLAIEFNHDEYLERSSRRPAELIERVLGDGGHLSNLQAAELLQAILAAGDKCSPQHLVQLHLSRECNRPALAAAAARRILGDEGSMAVHTSLQGRAGPILSLDASAAPYRAPARLRPAAIVQPCLPGME